MNLEAARDKVTTIFQRVLAEVDPERLTRSAITRIDGDIVLSGQRYALRPGGRIVLLGVGKSAVGMARGVEAALGDRLDHGVVVTKRGLAPVDRRLTRTEVLESSHPIPDEASVAAGRRLLSEASQLNADDLVICVVSGGGSALVEAPVAGVSLDDFKHATAILLRNGADIWTLNAVRRRLSLIKAGGLARSAAPARLVNLILSDVLGNPLGVIASGLSIDAEEDDQWRIDVMQSSPFWQELPAAVQVRLESASVDHPRNHANVCQSVVIGDAALAAKFAARAAQELGFRPVVLGNAFAGDAREFGRFWAQLAKSCRARSSSIDAPCCVVGVGEMTVNVQGDGRGGRNTEMAAAAAFEISGEDGIALASLASDGDDGSSGAAGGVVVGETIVEATRHGVVPAEMLRRNDTRALLEAAGGLIVTGQTGTNVNDLYLALIESNGRT